MWWRWTWTIARVCGVECGECGDSVVVDAESRELLGRELLGQRTQLLDVSTERSR